MYNQVMTDGVKNAPRLDRKDILDGYAI
jgi:hypothetical protein